MEPLTYLGLSFTSTVLSLALIVFSVLYIFHGLVRRKTSPDNFPPGPKGWPIVGNLPNFAKKDWMAKQIAIYGEVFTLMMGSLRVVHLSGKALKAALTEGHLLSERAPIPVMHEYFGGKGRLNASS